MASGPRDCPPRYATPRTESRKTLGTAAKRIANSLGLTMMPWQEQVIDTALEIENGQFVYKDVILTVPRQSGKSTLLLSLILSRALSQPNQRIVYTAQSRQDARKLWFETWIPQLESSPLRDLFKTRLANGDEALIFDNGSRQGLVASTAKAGHGQTLDLAIVDEAFSQADARLEQSLKPAQITRNQPPHRGAQFWVVSTAGTLTSSPYLLDKVEKGREIAASGFNKSVCYFEWSAEDGLDPADEETWWSCMPALGRTASVEAVRADFMSMDLHEFERAYLNRWTTVKADPVIPIELWDAQKRQYSSKGIPIALSVDVTPTRDAATIAAAGQIGDKIFVEIIKHQRGLSWVIPALKKLLQTHEVRWVVVDSAGPAGALLTGIEELYVEVKQTSTQELARACATLYDAVVDTQSVIHPGQIDVRNALDGAVRRDVGDGGWAWGRRNSGTDISALVAATLAHWQVKDQGTESAGIYSLDSIVAELRERKAREARERGEPEPVIRSFSPAHTVDRGERQVVERPGGVKFIPI